MDDTSSVEGLPSSSLDPLETTVQRSREQTRSQWRVHASTAKLRERIMDALYGDGGEDLRVRYERVNGCCAMPELRMTTGGGPSLRMNVCRDRLCPRCQRQRGWATGGKVAGLVTGFNAPRFMTLTLQHQEEGLGEMLDRLMKAFRVLRKDPLWKSRVFAGVWCVQVTRSRQEKRWHAHLHLIADGEYFPQKLLSKAWEEASGGSRVVDVRAVPDRKKIAGYIASYATRPDDLAGWSHADICEYARAMKGRRVIHTFGSAHGAKVEAATEPEEKGETTYVCHTGIITDAEKKGDGRAAFIVSTLGRLGRDWASAFGLSNTSEICKPRVVPHPDVGKAMDAAAQLYDEVWSPPTASPPRAEASRPRMTQQALGRWM